MTEFNRNYCDEGQKDGRARSAFSSESLFIAKGIGIFLVVVGHYQLSGTMPQYWKSVRELIYTFHMPLFMLLSGFLFALAKKSVFSIKGYIGFARKKTERLLYPYIAITVVLLLMKLAAGRFFTLSHPITNEVFYHIFLNPSGGFATLLWFIYTLLIIFLLFPPLKAAIRNDSVFFAVIVLLSFFQWTEMFCLNLVFHYLPFFSLGYFLRRVDFSGSGALAFGLIAILIFSFSYYLKMNMVEEPLLSQAVMLVLGASGSLFIMFLSVTISGQSSAFSGVFKSLGLYSSSIYLLHTIFMGPVKIAVNQMTRSDSAFLLAAPLVCGAGILLPPLIERHLVMRSAIAAKLILGKDIR